LATPALSVEAVKRLIAKAWPRDTKKHLARTLGCSLRTSKHIVDSGGRKPRHYRRRLLEALDAALARNETEIAKLRAELRAAEVADARAAGGLEADVDPPAPHRCRAAGW
jgi:hypothetical protein